jgi:glucose-6-phosphate-specific signal transduction histidine kinase
MGLDFRTTSDFLDDPFVGAAVKRLNDMEERLQFLRESNRNAAGQMSSDEHRKRRARARELSNDIKRRRKFLEVLETQSLEKSEARKGFRRSVNVATSRAVGRATRSLGQQAARRGLEDSEALQAGAAAQVQAAGARWATS